MTRIPASFSIDTHSLSPVVGNFMESTAWGDLVDPREAMYDAPDFFGDPSNGPLPARLEDRLNGDFFPIYRTEQELQIVHGIARTLVAGCGRAKGAALGNLTNYTIGTGCVFTVQVENDIDPAAVPVGLKEVIQSVVDRFLDKNDFQFICDREIHDRSREDGEAIIAIDPDRDGIATLNFFENEQLVTPRDPRNLEEHVEEVHMIDCSSFPSCWKYGVHTPEKRPDKPIGYHIVYDQHGDWDYYPVDRLEHIKRNVHRKSKRGVSDYWWVFQDFCLEKKISLNMGIGTALNAAIAYIREHTAKTTSDKAQDLVTAGRSGTRTIQYPGGNQRTLSLRRHVPGTIVDVSAGMQYKEGPLGANRNPHFMLPAEYILRSIGTFWQMPEYMISGDASNGNYASSLVAESPFVKAREADQAFYGEHFKSIVWKALKLAYRARLFDRYGLSWQQIVRIFDIKCEMPEVATRDPKAVAERQKVEIEMGTLSVRNAMIEAGRDPDEEERYIEEERQKAAARAPQIVPGQGGAVQQSNPQSPSPYGNCPQCGAPGETRERRPDGNDRCKNGHTYPSRDAVQASLPQTGPSSTLAAAMQGVIESADSPEEVRRTVKSLLEGEYP